VRETEIRDPVLLFVVLLLVIPAGAGAAVPEGAPAAVPSYTTTYTVTVQEDGTALWKVEYRTLLVSENDIAAFDNYTRDISSVYLPQVENLMEHSAAQAAAAVSRPMAISNMTGNAIVQTSPTGRYGVVIYTFTWSGFAKPEGRIAVGDAFAGGLYLAEDNTLILRYPYGWNVAEVVPAPDQKSDSLVWHGLRSFSPGEPRVILENPSSFPLVPAIASLVLVIVAGAGIMLYRARKRQAWPELPEVRDEPEEPAPLLTDAEAAGLEERILTLLANGGGEQPQSEIVKALGIPKSTVSSALNSLHAKGRIVKVKKGRENLIRLVREQK
jgi:uncharacterized membrane protein